ncbi:MAG TPA: alpha/beta fold hydrolase [Acidimicrobiales bacterium]|nr:alpha/beta fold hydrolase [Acidimicrobiales bacterium]
MRFVLVHGGFHGAWCWSRTVPQLERLGHEAIAVDLPGHGERRGETEPTTLAGRTAAITSVLRAGDVLVGHSGGGFDITHAADAAPGLVGHVCYLAAGLPREGRTWPEAMATRDDGTMGDFDVAGMLQHLAIGDDGAMSVASAEGARALFFHDCDDETVRWAFERLGPERAGETSTTPVSLPAFWAADLPRSFVRCTDDRAQPEWLADLVAARLGVEPLRIDASHSPFLSRPAELAELLVHATTTTPTAPLRPG